MNYQPSTPLKGHKLAVILPYKDKETRYNNQPLASPSGKVLQVILSQAGLPHTSCYVGYLSDRMTLMRDLEVLKPNCCLLIGDEVMREFGQRDVSINKFRGSIFHSEKYDVKCVPTYQVGQVMTNYSWMQGFKSDVFRAVAQSRFKGIKRPDRKLISYPSFQALVLMLKATYETQKEITIDLEGHPNDVGVTCISIAHSPEYCYIVPLRNMDHSGFFSLEEETIVWQWLGKILSSPSIRKTAQNALYELFVFAWRHKILIRGMFDDTMFQQWELFHEQPKGLDYIASIHTEEPYYKNDRTKPDLYTHHEYCCKDSVVTHEAKVTMDSHLSQNKRSQQHYKFNTSLLRPYLYMTLRGCKIDQQRVDEHRSKTWEIIQHQQGIVNEMAGRVLNVKSPKQLKEFLYGELGLPPQMVKNAFTKRSEPSTNAASLANLIVKEEVPIVLEIMKLIRARTRFSDINKLQTFSDGRIRCNYDPTGTETGRLNSKATWIETMVRAPKVSFVKGQLKLLYKNEKRSLGTNLQNQTKDLRDCFIADDGYEFYQYDLAGADAWTVAADLQRLGNSRMMDHLKAGVKPSVVIALLTEFGDRVYSWTTQDLKQIHQTNFLLQCKQDPSLAHKYVGAKGCQHGTNYGMGPPLMSVLNLTRSLTGWIDSFNFGKTTDPLVLKTIHSNTMARYQKLYTEYYGLELRNEWVAKQLCNFGYIDCASGARRYFTTLRSRHNIPQATIRQAASHEPQANTTYATNKALVNMYYDPQNRTPRGALRCEANIMVHDALCGQTHTTQKEWSKEQLENKWFKTKLNVSGIEVEIPVEGGFGPNWKATD